MKKTLFFILSFVPVLALATTPTAADLASYYQQGQACLCIQFQGPVCNDIVWAGSYNSWSTDVNSMAKFQPLTGFNGWYIVAVSDNSESIKGKPVQLKSDGTFDWTYQTGAQSTWTIHSGSASFAVNEWNEAQFENISTSTPLIATSSAWKNSPCSTPDPTPTPSTTAYSGTLPVLYINTANNEAITSKDYYLTATYWLDNLGLDGYTSIASQSKPDTLQIKGRGNWTWTGFDKKPYRLKLNKKAALMGLKKNKHFGLLACADDQFCYVKNTMGYILSRQLDLEWTPGQAPVEVVLNGDYIGLYMLTELVRVDKDRVNVFEQPDGCTAADSITGGWLVEIDNYEEPYHVTVTEPENQWHYDQTIWFTPKTPEILSAQQSAYLQAQMNAINTALYANDSSASLQQILDIDEAARFYLVQELMSDCESYHGSCYLHKEKGNNQLWKFGPVWDFGNSFNDRNQFIYDSPQFSQIWIGQLASHPVFQQAVSKLWKHWRYYDQSVIAAQIDSFANQIAAAAVKDAARWPQYNHSDVASGKSQFMTYITRHANWLATQWGEGQQDTTTAINEQTKNEKLRNLGTTKFLKNGRLILFRNGTSYDLSGRKF